MLSQKVIHDNISKLHTNNNNYITISFTESEYINLYIYEKIISFLNQKQSQDTIKYSSYILYNSDKIILHLNDNGSSNCYSQHLKYVNKLKVNNIDIVFKSYINKKQNNDAFESSYNYENIDLIESLTYTYNGIDIELLKIIIILLLKFY